jgi:hypothetical protein
MNIKPTLCPSWELLGPQHWNACKSGLLTVGRLWPAWVTGTPPTITEFAAESRVTLADRVWLLARILYASSREVCLLWAADCAEVALRHTTDEWIVDHSLGLINAVRVSAVTGERMFAAAYAAAAAAYAADAAAHAAAHAAYAAAHAAYAAAHDAAAAAAYAAYAADAAGGRQWQIACALGWLGLAEFPAWPDVMVWR